MPNVIMVPNSKTGINTDGLVHIKKDFLQLTIKLTSVNGQIKVERKYVSKLRFNIILNSIKYYYCIINGDIVYFTPFLNACDVGTLSL